MYPNQTKDRGKDMKSVLYVGCDIPDGNAAAIRVFSNSLALKEYGYKVNILSLDHDFRENNDLISEYSGCCVIRYPYPKSKVSFFKHLFSIVPYKKTIDKIIETENLAVVVVYDQPAISFLRLRSYCHKSGIKIICDCAEWHTAIHLKGIARLIKSIDTGISMHYAYKKADGLIAISKYLEQYFSDNGVMKNVIRIPPLQNEKKRRDSIDVNSQRVFIYAGVAGRDKDCLDIILKAFSEVKTPFVFNLFGLTEEECISVWPETARYIEKVRIRSQIVFHGKKKHSVILEETSKADYCVIIRENTRKNNAGFPTKFAESIECGTPVIANEFSDVCGYIRDYGFGICITEKMPLTEVIEEAIQKSDAEIEKIKKNCYISNMFSYKSYVDKLGNFVDGLTNDK